jgi:hypothetical protein
MLTNLEIKRKKKRKRKEKKRRKQIIAKEKKGKALKLVGATVSGLAAFWAWPHAENDLKLLKADHFSVTKMGVLSYEGYIYMVVLDLFV